MSNSGEERAARSLRIARAVNESQSKSCTQRRRRPSNILLDENDEPLLADFGVARLADTSRLSAMGMTIGTPRPRDG